MRRRASFIVSPLLSLIGAVLSSLRRFPQAATSHDKRAAIAARLPWRDFERLVATGFQQRGFQIVERGGSGAAGEVDWVLTRGSARFLARCRQGWAQHVDVQVIRELCAAMKLGRAAGGFVVTSGSFTKDALKFARGRKIELIDGGALNALLKDGRRRIERVIFEGIAANGPEMAPFCPACKTPMVVRTVRRAAGAGSLFWACAQSPQCRQTMVMWSERRRSA